MSVLTETMALKALDGLVLRAEVTSQNIANAGSPGYRPLTVAFEEALAAAAPLGAAAVDAVQPVIAPDTGPAQGAGVRLDLQMAASSMTTARYAALVQILSLQLQQTRAALGT